MNAPSRAEIARISAALVAALGEAQQLVRVGNLGSELAALLQHARDLYALMEEALASAGGAVPSESRAVAAKVGEALTRMEKALHEDGSLH